MQDKELDKFIVENMISEMGALIETAKIDYQEEAAVAIRDEFINKVKENPLLDGVDACLLSRVDSMIFRAWLFEYKDRGFVLTDIGNSHWKYLCTAEEALIGIHYNKFGSEY